METIALDVHCHLAPLAPGRTAGMRGIGWDADGRLITIDGYQLAAPSVYRVEALIAWMDENRVARSWISIPPPLYRLGLDPVEAEAWTACVNRALADAAARHPDRLSPLFHLPVQHPALAAAIAARQAATHRPLFAMAAGSADAGLVLSDSGYAGLWQVLDQLRAFLFLHPVKGCDPRYEAFYLHNLLGSPVETALAAAHLALSGILERHQGITLCLAHGGGATAAVAGRLERGQVTGRPGADTGAERPRQAFRRVAVDCICHDPDALVLAGAMHGRDNVFFGSDWPFSMGLPKPHEQLAATDHAFRDAIFQHNPRRLLSQYRLTSE
jgi:aminocarboxymuconate-semialdehyde decarboxylase